MFATLLLPALLAAAPADGAAPLTSRITEVVVHADSARVRRSAQVEHSGPYVLAGLPGSLDSDALRVRLAAGSVLGVEVADRWQQAVPDAEVQALRTQLDALRWQQRELDDQRKTLQVLREHVSRLLSQQDRSVTDETAAGKPDPAAWQKVLTFAAEQLAQLDAQARDADRASADLATREADLQSRLDAPQSQQRVHLRDVTVEVQVDAPTALDVEYFVADAGWAPLYDLRAAADGTSVDLAYRARVWQRTGEPWNDVDLVLSTAQPQRGAQGPEPQALRLHVAVPAPAAASTLTGRGRLVQDELAKAANEAEASLDGSMVAPAPSTAVMAQGLSVQFKLPRKESVPSREQPVTVLIGEQALPVALERQCVPQLDTTVWVRGITHNGTPWTMLPGEAAVYFGQDYVGQSWFGEPVLPEQEFTLHLGADPGLKVERVKTDEEHEEPGLFSKRQSDTVAWRVRLTNNGAQPARADGSVDVLVREAVPLPADERIEVEVSDESHEPLADERWSKDQAEQGIRTWRLSVPRGASEDLTFRVTTSWPEKTALETAR
jgi:uncharacterized protein (TIGR02231 family)